MGEYAASFTQTEANGATTPRPTKRKAEEEADTPPTKKVGKKARKAAAAAARAEAGRGESARPHPHWPNMTPVTVTQAVGRTRRE